MNISRDTTGPVVSDVTVSNITYNSYTVSCRVSDNCGVARVSFPSWHSSVSGQNAIWLEGSVQGNVASCTVKVDKLGGLSGEYITHIYAYDACGNSGFGETTVEVDRTLIREREVMNLGADFEGYLYNHKSKKVLSVDSSDNVVSKTDTKAETQRWRFVRNSDGSYTIISKASGKCLDNDGGHGTSESNVGVYTANGTGAQKWYILKGTGSYYYLRPACSDTCVLDVWGASQEENANIIIYTFNDTTAQQFGIVDSKPIEEYTPQDIGDNFNAEIENIGSGKVLTASGSDVRSNASVKSDSQDWKFTRNPDGSYCIQSKSTGKYLNCQDASGVKKSNVNIAQKNNSNAQKWDIYDAGGDCYYLKAKCSKDCVIDLLDYDVSEGANIGLYTLNKTMAQRFMIHKKIVKVQALSLSKTQMELTAKGETSTLTANVTPSNATNRKLFWSTSNPAVATVDASGKVSAVANGQAVITVTAEDGGYAKSCNVTVNIPIPVTGASLDCREYAFIAIGEQTTLHALIFPANASNTRVKWRSSDERVATVDAGGIVTAVGSGSAEITATTEDGAKTVVCRVSVTLPIRVRGINLDETEIMFTDFGTTRTLIPTVVPSNADEQDVIWVSSNPAVATVSESGVVTSVGVGETYISAETVDGAKTALCHVTVNVVQTINVGGISLSRDRISLSNAGETQILTANITPANASDKFVTWHSSNASVALVSDMGEVTALEEGTSIISATTRDGNKTAVCTVTVQYDTICMHDYERRIVEEPTCLKMGLEEYLCRSCGDTYTETLPRLSHVWGEWMVFRAATCTIAGQERRICGNCGESEARPVPAIGHEHKEIRNRREATCSTAGYTGDTHCIECQARLLSGTVIPKTDIHTWDEGKVIKAATESEAGEKQYVCSVCGIARVEVLKATGIVDRKETEVPSPVITPPKNTIPQPGSLIENEESIVYRILTAGDASGTVEYVSCPYDEVTFIGLPKIAIFEGVTYAVTAVGDRAFANNRKLVSVLIPEGIEVIGDSAFEGCKSLKKVIIPSSVAQIGNRAFYKCRKLENLTIRTKKLTKKNVGSKAFSKAGSVNYKKFKVKIPKVKRRAYKKLLKRKGLSSKVKMK